MNYDIKYKSHGSEEVYPYLKHYSSDESILFNLQDVEQERVIAGVGEK